jgi:two-component system, NtrC family, sensor histidine kinase PilS
MSATASSAVAHLQSRLSSSAAAAKATPDTFWTSLGYFNLARIIIAATLLAAILIYRDIRPFGNTNPELFSRACAVYLFMGITFWWAMTRMRTLFIAHLTVHVVVDIIIIALLLHASGGVRSGLGILLLMPLAAASSVSRGRISVFFAALATIALLIENTYWVLYFDVALADYAPVGLLASACFVVAIITNRLAKRLITNEDLVRTRSADLRNQLEVNRLIIRDMSSGVLVVDAQGLVVLANPEAQRLLGRPVAQGAPLVGISRALEDARTRWRAASGPARPQIEINGRGVEVRLVEASVEAETGELLIYLEDVSKAQQQAQQAKLAALGRLTANIAHEIRNPLSAMTHAAELLREDVRDGTTQTARLTRIINDNAVRLNRIVQEVLQLNRRDRAQPESVDLQGIITEVVAQLCDSSRLPPSAFVVSLSGMHKVEFDRQHLHQILWNLVGNAWRHSRQSEEAVLISVTSGPDGRVELAVQDNGIGVAAENEGALFEPFFTTDAKGTGLGLYIARELAAANRARLAYVPMQEREAQSGMSGAEFRLTFGYDSAHE